MKFVVSEHPHRRYNPLKDEWVLVSPHRTKRPWQGQQESVSDARPSYDAKCYLCPGNERAGGLANPPYNGTFVFENDFAAMLPTKPQQGESGGEFFRAEPVSGVSRVICFHPRHDLTLPELDKSEIGGVIDTWIEQTRELGEKYAWVQIFENKGSVMGCSNPHPHGQVWAGDFIPNEAAREDAAQKAYFKLHGRSLLLDYAAREVEAGARIVALNDDWVALVPYWAVWPFEILLLPRTVSLRLTDLGEPRKKSLALILKETLTRYDNLFETSFPYSMGWHGAPFAGESQEHWQLHAHFYPPLLRSATVKKFMVGYEMLGEAQRDLTPEQAALKLREVSPIHYKAKGSV